MLLAVSLGVLASQPLDFVYVRLLCDNQKNYEGLLPTVRRIRGEEARVTWLLRGAGNRMLANFFCYMCMMVSGMVFNGRKVPQTEDK